VLKAKDPQGVKEAQEPVLALVPVSEAGTSTSMEVQLRDQSEETLSNDSNKKQKTLKGRSADQAEAAMQPRQAQ
jgi:hypothetical protein